MVNNELLLDFLGDDRPEHLWVYSDEADFNTNWNSLMRVVEKIESLDVVNELYISNNRVVITTYEDFNLVHWFVASDRDFETKIDALYEACVKFVKWYRNV